MQAITVSPYLDSDDSSLPQSALGRVEFVSIVMGRFRSLSGLGYMRAGPDSRPAQAILTLSKLVNYSGVCTGYVGMSIDVTECRVNNYNNR